MKFKETANFTDADLVRISEAQGLFEKGYLSNWSEELFEVSKSLKSYSSKHLLKDLMGEKVTGGFYEQERLKLSNLIVI